MSYVNPNLILLKRNMLSGVKPDVSDLQLGEIAVNSADGIIFTAITNTPGISSVVSFLNSDQQPYILNQTLSSVNTQYGGNTVTQVFASVLGGYNNDVTGGGSTVINGENNDIDGDFSFIGSGYKNKISAAGDYSAILGGSNNLISHQNSFALGSNLSSNAANFTYVNNLSVQGELYGNFQIDASDIVSGTLDAARLPVFNGDITTTISNTGSVSAKVVAIQGSPISTQLPVNGQTLQWNGTAWTPGAIPNGGSGGGGLVYYLNYANEAQTPTTNLSSTPNTPKELGITGVVGSSSYTLTNVSTTNYDLICGFVSLTASPNTTVIPAGLWDFNIWADSTATVANQMILRLNVFKYDGSNIPTLLASSGDIYLYDPNTPSQYIASVVFPQTTLLTTDRIYIELRAKGTKNNKDVTIYFGGSTPAHVHTTFPSVGGSGLLKVIDGVYQNPASLLVNTDVAANAEIDQSKINGLTDVSSKANTTYTTVNTISSNWESAYTTVKSKSANWDAAYSSAGEDLMVRSLTGFWDSNYNTVYSLSSNWSSSYASTTTLNLSSDNWNIIFTNVQTNSANWQTAYAYVSANSVNLTATNIFVTNDLTVTDTVSAKYYQGTLIDWMTLVRGTKTTPTLLATIGTGDVYTYVYSTATTDKTYYRYIATDGSEDSFYGNFINPTLSNLIATKKIIL